MSVSPEPATDAAPRYPRGAQLTVLLSVAADAEYEVCAPGGTTVPMLEGVLPSRSLSRVVVPCGGYPGVVVAEGDIKPVLIAMAQDALRERARVIGCGACEPGRPCPDCVIDAERRREYQDILDALGEPPGT